MVDRRSATADIVARPDALRRAGRADPLDAVIGRRVRRIRAARGLSQTELGIAISVTFQQIQKYESGANRIAASTLVRIATALDVTTEDLLSPGVTPADGGAAPPRSSLLSTPGAEALLAGYARLEPESLRRAVLAFIRELGGDPR